MRHPDPELQGGNIFWMMIVQLNSDPRNHEHGPKSLRDRLRESRFRDLWSFKTYSAYKFRPRPNNIQFCTHIVRSYILCWCPSIDNRYECCICLSQWKRKDFFIFFFWINITNFRGSSKRSENIPVLVIYWNEIINKKEREVSYSGVWKIFYKI